MAGGTIAGGIRANGLGAASRGTMGYIAQAQKAREKSGQQLASGNRITNAAVDAAGMAIVEKMIAQIGGLDQAWRNVQDGMSMMQTAEGAMEGIGDMAGRINELTVQAANGTLTDEERGALQQEVDQLVGEIDSMAGRTEFNKKKLLDGSLDEEGGGLWIQSGANAGQGMRLSINGLKSEDLGLSGISFVGKDGAEISGQIGAAQGAVSTVAAERSRLGAYINRMEHTSNALGVMGENMEASKSRIADTDMAKAMMANTKAGIMQQASMGMLGRLMKDAYSMSSMLLSVAGR
jgi:flagellin